MQNEMAVRSRSTDAEWYFSSKLLVNQWARIIGPDAFLVYHHFKSRCYDRGENTPYTLGEAGSIALLGMRKKRFQAARETLFKVGLLVVENENGKSTWALPDPEDVPLPEEQEPPRA